MGKNEKWITHYCSSHKILLVGEGDFSFSACLARSFGSATNMVATSFDTKEELKAKHWSSVPHLEELRRLGCIVRHGIDVYDMHADKRLAGMVFDRIVYNFPHAGHQVDLCERSNELIKRHKELVQAFFHSASKMISGSGEVHVVHRDDDPYLWWKIEKLAKKAGLVLKEKMEFRKQHYPGYHNKRGGGIKSNKTFPIKDQCFTFKFCLISAGELNVTEGTIDGLVSSLSDLLFVKG